MLNHKPLYVQWIIENAVNSTPLTLNEDAICLSGLTGTRLKCEEVGQYYKFWWGITSGGASKNYRYPTAIVELNAATGEDYIEETNETVLGSSGHAIDLKVKESPKTANLKIVLVEEDQNCYNHLKRVIERRWPSIPLNQAEGPITSNFSNVYLFKESLDEAIASIAQIDLGNAMYFFDPLKSVKYSAIESVASSRMRMFFETRTEFIVFIFTSDWFLGRKESAPLPCSSDENDWSPEEKTTVMEADELFGGAEWRDYILTNDPIPQKENLLIELYRRRLHRWFRYVLPMPFNPKYKQLFHLILCSNYEAGVRASRDFYCKITGNPKYSPDNSKAFAKFGELHPELLENIAGNRKPIEWKILWRVIREHEEGICDRLCPDLRQIEPYLIPRRAALQWLVEKGYLDLLKIEHAWKLMENRYIVNWETVKERLEVDPPLPLVPLQAEDPA